MSKLRPANPVLSLVSKLPKQPDFLAQKRLLLASQEVSICPDVGLCANGAWWIMLSLRNQKPPGPDSRANKVGQAAGSGIGGVMPEIENLQNSAERCFELASSSNLLEEDVALDAFELLTANQYDCVLAHGLGVSL